MVLKQFGPGMTFIYRFRLVKDDNEKSKQFTFLNILHCIITVIVINNLHGANVI